MKLNSHLPTMVPVESMKSAGPILLEKNWGLSPIFSMLLLGRKAHRLGEEHALVGPQLELLGRVLLVAVVKPGG